MDSIMAITMVHKLDNVCVRPYSIMSVHIKAQRTQGSIMKWCAWQRERKPVDDGVIVLQMRE